MEATKQAVKKPKKDKDILEQRVELSLLYDFYGALLKENQRQIFEAYILEDYSLSEIAEEMQITRQGVHDTVKRVSRQLMEYEERLGLLNKFQEQKHQMEEIHTALQNVLQEKQNEETQNKETQKRQYDENFKNQNEEITSILAKIEQMILE